ncbi:MAG TPA: 3-deoxy-D-manno-octulosonic acid transferase [Verrucomicrobiae bacterium]|nr:3-deoxy-D-manno-octulosonic acid transferase [Verrucomicrobiae bacterium]
MRRRGNWRAGFAERFGKFNVVLKQSITNRQVLWLHAVSVGEVNLCTNIIRDLELRTPNLKMVVSTTTTTGMGELKKKLPTHVAKIYYPLDLRKYVSRALSAIYPEAIVLVEAEIWPNFIWRAADMGIPIFLVNARLSDRSYRGYKRFGFLFRPLFASFAGVGVQNEADAKRVIDLGCRPEVVRIVGNLKFDAAELGTQVNLNVGNMLRQVGVPKDARVLLCASTHNGEEAVLGEIFLRLRKQFPDLFLVMVPRHFERSREAGRDLKDRGVKFIYRSDVGSSTQLKPGEVDCLLVNSTGELKYFYEYATVVFVGKSLTAEGGQNPIEPAAVSKPVVFGPNMQNFADIVREFLSKDGAVQVQNATELEKKLAELLGNETRREELGRNAVKVVRENLGAIHRTVDMIVQRLDNGEIYIKK